MDKDFYSITMAYSGLRYARTALINNQLDWKWTGVLHEAVDCQSAKSSGALEKVFNVVVTDGARSKDPRKYEKDAEVLEAGLLEEPNNSRYVFYLAQSYMDCGKFEKAIENYERRIKMGGWDQEVFYSMLKIADIQERMDMPHDVLVKSYKRAFSYRSSRAEPLYHLSTLLNGKKDYEAAYKVAKIGATMPPSKDILFVQHWISDYGLPLELSVSAYWTERYEESKELSEALLKKELPDNIRATVQANLEFANERLREKAVDSLLNEALESALAN
jgi:tetratricopeptide (TPR) repeat protein